MIALVDTNVVLDVMLSRKPFFADSAAVLAAVERSRCQGLLGATTVTTIHYIAGRVVGYESSLKRIAQLMSIFGVAAVNRSVLDAATGGKMRDFDDAVLHEAALQAGADCIVTRNVKDFAGAIVPVYLPRQFLGMLE